MTPSALSTQDGLVHARVRHRTHPKDGGGGSGCLVLWGQKFVSIEMDMPTWAA